MILVAESGSTKTDWKLIDQNKVQKTIHTDGINPFHQRQEDITRIISTSALAAITDPIDEIYFYGAGCNYPENIRIVRESIRSIFNNARIFVEHDLLAAARALCGRSQGIACILGTGSNSCFFDGQSIKQANPSLGYILGDEGSGVYMGKKLLRDVLYQDLPKSLYEKFMEIYQVTVDDALDNVYNKYLPNRYIASFTKFIGDNIHHPYMHGLVYESFLDFIECHVISYPQAENYKVHFVGSVAFNFKNVLERVVVDAGLIMGTVIEFPINGLILYHQNKI